MNPAIMHPLQVKDSRWLTLEVCREFTRNKCTRSETDCKFAHPPVHVEVQNGRVTCCFDSIKGKCQRKDPPCKYLHPPQHLREQLLQNGRNNLILKNLQMQALAAGLQPMVPGVMPTMVCESQSPKPLTAFQQTAGHMLQAAQHPHAQAAAQHFSPLMAAHPFMMAQQPSPYAPYAHHMAHHAGATIQALPQGMPISPVESSPAAAVSANGQIMPTQPKVARADRLESPSCSSSGTDGLSPVIPGSYADTLAAAGQPTTAAAHYSSPIYFQPVEVMNSAGKKRPRDPSDDFILGMSMPGMVPMMKRPATMDTKSGIPMYQPGAAMTYQHALAAMNLQQPFVPVTIAGHPPSVPRF